LRPGLSSRHVVATVVSDIAGGLATDRDSNILLGTMKVDLDR
jgi:hypothetical protein